MLKKPLRLFLALHFFLFCTSVPGLASEVANPSVLPEPNGSGQEILNSQKPISTTQTFKDSAPDKPAGVNSNALDLALKTISLSQGEGGFELWRLKAAWANVQKQDERILVDEPRLTYFMREEGQVMYVQSETGEVDQKSQILRFINKVRVTQNDKLLTGDLLVYDGNAKTMTFPDGGDFASTDVSGNARSIVWHIDNKLIDADGDVFVHLDGPEPQMVHGPDTRIRHMILLAPTMYMEKRASSPENDANDARTRTVP